MPLGLKGTIDRAPADLQDELLAVQESSAPASTRSARSPGDCAPGCSTTWASSISALTADRSEASRIPVARRLNRRLPPLSREAELVYRIAQESPTNVIRHAKATHVELSLTAEEDRVILSITNDGRGMNRHRKCSEIRGTPERALLISADLTAAMIVREVKSHAIAIPIAHRPSPIAEDLPTPTGTATSCRSGTPSVHAVYSNTRSSTSRTTATGKGGQAQAAPGQPVLTISF